MKVKLDHCVISVTDWDRSNDFYSRVLGAELVPVRGGWAYRLGETQLNVHGPGQPGDPNARVPVAPGGSDLCFEWPGAIEAAAEHLRAQGVKVELGPLRRHGARGSGMSVYFRDPDGSLLELISYDEAAMSDFKYFDDAVQEPVEEGRLVDIENDLPAIELGAGLLSRPLAGQLSMASFVRWQPNTVAPKHAHAEEQIFVVLEGELEIDLGGEVRLMRAGDAALIPAWVPHSVRSFDAPAYQIDFFSPPRQALLRLLEQGKV